MGSGEAREGVWRGPGLDFGRILDGFWKDFGRFFVYVGMFFGIFFLYVFEIRFGVDLESF